MKTFAQQTPLERAQAHIDYIKKASTLLRQSPHLPLDKPDDRAWEPDAETAEAKRKAIENCELASADYARAGHDDMAELYSLKAQSIAGSPSATRDYFRKLEEVRSRRADTQKQPRKSNAGAVFFVLLLGGIIAFIAFKAGNSTNTNISTQTQSLNVPKYELSLVSQSQVELRVSYGPPGELSVRSDYHPLAPGQRESYAVPSDMRVRLDFKKELHSYDEVQSFNANGHVIVSVDGRQLDMWNSGSAMLEGRDDNGRAVYTVFGEMVFTPAEHVPK